MPTDMSIAVANAELLVDQASDSSAGPDRSHKAAGFGALIEEGRQLRFLLLVQASGASARFCGAQRLGTRLSSAFDPLADGALSDLQRLGDVDLTKAELIHIAGA